MHSRIGTLLAASALGLASGAALAEDIEGRI